LKENSCQIATSYFETFLTNRCPYNQTYISACIVNPAVIDDKSYFVKQ